MLTLVVIPAIYALVKRRLITGKAAPGRLAANASLAALQPEPAE